jgi:beta-lactamase regulating signal transducer with metallopeptidase domain
MTFAWAAVQVTLVMLPAAALQAWASRRSAASGAWMAAVGLALGAAVSVAAFVPRARRGDESPGTVPIVVAKTVAGEVDRGHAATSGVAGRQPAGPSGRSGRPSLRRPALSFDGFLGILGRLELGAAAPAARLRRFGGALAVVGIAGAGVGLIRLLVGLWAVRLCRHRGTIVRDPEVLVPLEEIRRALGGPRAVEVRELPELTTPATAGWRHPLILLPPDWRTWREAERRAVLAHELAHISRWDYAAGLVARLAVALNAVHPLVHWMAGRLQLQQELAADAVAARFAGGREAYLHTLARLALEQDGPSPGWPLRAFLTGRGTLIRRIAMLQKESVTEDRPWPRPGRLLAGLCLLVVASSAAMLRGPAWAGEGEKRRGSSQATRVAPNPGGDGVSPPDPFDLQYVSEGVPGIVALRPAACVRHPGLAGVARLLEEVYLTMLANQCGVSLSQPGRLKLGLADIEWVTTNLNFGRGGVGEHGEPLHTIMMGAPVAVRTTRPFDWLRFLREWRFEFEEAREGDRVYYKVTGVVQPQIGSDPCVYLPDDRTMVLSDTDSIRKLIRRRVPFHPAHLTGADWDRVSRGLLVLAIQDRDGVLAKDYDLGRPDDEVVLPLLKGVDHWVLGVDDTESLGVHAFAACRGDASATIARTAETLVTLGRAAVGREAAAIRTDENAARALRLAEALLANLRVGHDDHSVRLDAEGFGTLAELGTIAEAGLKVVPVEEQVAEGPENSTRRR